MISNPSTHSKPSRGNTPPSFTPCQFCRKTNHASQNCFFKQEQKPSRPTGPEAQKITKVNTSPEQTICQKFNTFVKASCQLPNGTCSFRRQHICLVCKKPKCKKIKHFPTSSPPTINIADSQTNIEPSQQQVILNQLQHLNSNMTTVSTRLSKLEQRNTVLPQQTPDAPCRTVVVSSPGPSLQGVLGLPAISDLEHYSIDSCPDLSNRNILWTRVKSGGLSLPLPIDSCCSVSLVSGSHTDHLLASQPNLQFTPLSKKIPVSVANPNATLFATGTMQVPITFENRTNCTFLMLSVPGLAWPLMLGENHQITTKALVDHYALTIIFRHPAINTTIQCEKDNPLHAFPSLVPPTTSTNSASSSSATATPITCLLTGMPTPAQPKHRIELHRAFNLITVCITLTTALLGST